MPVFDSWGEKVLKVYQLHYAVWIDSKKNYRLNQTKLTKLTTHILSPCGKGNIITLVKLSTKLCPPTWIRGSHIVSCSFVLDEL